MVHELKRKSRDDSGAAEHDAVHGKRRNTRTNDVAGSTPSSFAVPTALRFATESWQGMKPTNEDRHVVDMTRFPGPMFGVFDGHGGVFTVEFLVRHLLKTLHASLKQHVAAHEVDALTALRDESDREAKRKRDIEAQLRVCQEQLAQVQQLVGDSTSDGNVVAALATNNNEQQATPDTASALNTNTGNNNPDDSVSRALREQLCSAVHALELALAQIERDDAARREQFSNWVLRHDAVVKRALADSFARTDALVLQKNASRDGATALLLCFVIGSSIDDNARGMAYYYTANLGDCRAVLCRGGLAIPLTADHKPNRPDERQRIVTAGGFVGTFAGVARVYSAAGAGLALPPSQSQATKPTYLAVSRAFGDAPLKTPTALVSSEPEVQRFRVERDDLFIVLASDGIWDVLSNQDAVAVALAHFDDPQRAADALVKEAYRRGSSDNLTATVVQFGWHDNSQLLTRAQAAASNAVRPSPNAVSRLRFGSQAAAATSARSESLSDAAAAAAAGETTENQDDDDDDDDEIDMFNL